MFIDALGLLLDGHGQNSFYTLDRHGLTDSFDLDGALDPTGHRRVGREPTIYDSKTVEGLDPVWWGWRIPDRYAAPLRGA